MLLNITSVSLDIIWVTRKNPNVQSHRLLNHRFVQLFWRYSVEFCVWGVTFIWDSVHRCDSISGHKVLHTLMGNTCRSIQIWALKKKKSQCLPIIRNPLHSVPWSLVPSACLPKRRNSRSNRTPLPHEVHGRTSTRGPKVSCLERCRTSDVCRTNSLLQLCLNYTQNLIRLWILKTSRMNPHCFRKPHKYQFKNFKSLNHWCEL